MPSPKTAIVIVFTAWFLIAAFSVPVNAQDCNNNGILDACDIACGAVAGPCDVPGCGGSQDCNNNGIPDECEFQSSSALDFDGLDDWVRVPRDVSLEPTNDLTIEAWVRADSAGSFHSKILRIAGDFGPGYLFSWQQSNDNRAQLRIDGTTGGFTRAVDDVPTSTYFGQWHHFAGVYSLSGNFCRLYVDGVLKDDQPAAGLMLYAGDDLIIGNFNASTNEDFDGLIDEVRIWNTARTGQEINTDMLRSLLGNEPGLVGYWRFNEGQGQDAFDSSPMGNHGFLGTDNLPAGDSADPAWVVTGAPITETDCNDNGTLDECDIAAMTSDDCNLNGIPDECEPGGGSDCDTDGITDLCEIFNGSPDCDNDAIPDECQLTSNDCNGNSIPDNCEPDCNGNGIADECDISSGTSQDVNSTGVPDECEFFLVTERVQPCGRLYLIPENSIDAVHVFNRSGSPVTLLQQGQIDYLGGTITFDAAGNLLVSEWDNDRVLVIATDGTLVRTISGSSLNGPHGATLTPSGDIAVCSYLTDSIRFFQADDTFLSNLASNIEDPQCLAYDRDGNLYVGNRNNGNGNIAVFNPQLAFVQNIGAGQFNPHPLDMAFDLSQDLYVTRPNAVLKFDRGGSLLATLTQPGLAPKGIAIDENGIKWVTNDSARDIYRFDAADQFLDTISIDLGPGAPANLKLYGIAFNVGPDTDCNGNGQPDACEIDAGTVVDCNLNGLPDECDLAGNDCNSNGTPDDCEPDCDGDLVLDECEIASCLPGDLSCGDCNANGVPDGCETNSEDVSLQFDGLDDFVALPSNFLPWFTSPTTLEIWFKTLGSGVIIGQQTAPTFQPLGGHVPLLYVGLDGKLRAEYWWGSPTTLVSTALVNDDQWHHAAISYDLQTFRLYLDGIEIAQKVTSLVEYSTTVYYQLGTGYTQANWPSANGSWFDFQGRLDEFAAWSVARSESQIQQDMSHVLTGNETGLITYLRLNEGVGQLATDSSMNNNDGILGINTDPLGDASDPAWQMMGAPILSFDCNGNGTLDECDIVGMTSEDCNLNSIPDECEPGGAVDCNGNGQSDLCDIQAGTSLDCNGDSIPDDCQLIANDCNANGIPDECDLPGNDCNANNIPDDCEIASGTSQDCDNNGAPDECQIILTNTAYQFDGSNDYIFVPNSNSISISSSLTVEFMAKIDNPSGGNQLLVIKGDDQSGHDPYFVRVSSGTLEWSIQDDSNAISRLFVGISQLDWSQYHHIAGVFDDPADELRVYIDGQLLGTLSTTLTPALDQTPHYMTIGGTVSSGQHFQGTLDEIRVWALARSQQDIQDAMSRNLIGTESGLAAYWRFNDGLSQTASDASPNSNDGRLGTNDDPAGDNRDPLLVSQGAPLATGDCNSNGVLDACDIAGMTSEDCNLNGLPDECEPGGAVDCNGNGQSDLCDLMSGTSQDCNGDAIPDDCQLAGNDCNSNGVPDDCELTASDCNGNNIPDDCEIAAQTSDDCNTNGIPDECEIQATDAALDFDGVLDFVRVPNTADLQPTQDLTVEAWVRPDSVGSRWSRVIFGGRTGSSGSGGYMLAWQQNNDRRVQFQVKGASGSLFCTDDQDSGVYDGTWHHLAGVYSVSGNFTRLYIDGVLKNECSGVGALIYANEDFLLATDADFTQSFFDGLIDEVRVWNIARTQQELLNDMNLSLIGNEPGLIGYWRLNDGSGQIAVDSSSNGNDGTLGNDAGVDSADPSWAMPGAPINQGDCNNNGTLDECDIADMTSTDCNLNGIPDECESIADCNNNGIQDICDIFSGTSLDCDNDGVPNVCELSGNDCNFNSIPDNCETGGTEDCNINGTPDLCDIFNGTSLDCNNNAVPDDCDISSGTSTDVNGNSIPDDCELDARVIPVITLIDPATTTEVRPSLPASLGGVVEGSRYFIEVWASDVGSVNTGLNGVYVDVSFCTTNVATNVFHGSTFDFLPLGTVQSGGVDEFGGATFQANAAIEPEWVRTGWIEMNPGAGVSPCTISLLPSQNGVGAVGRGILDWAFVDLGSIDLAITPTTVTYDLDGDGFIGFGDFALFSGSWLQTVPPADPAHDFDCDGFVGPGDLSWFATGWQKNVGDPTILFPVCSPAAAARGAGPGAADVETRVVILSAPSASNMVTTLPTSISSVALGSTYFVEIWASDIGDINSGFTSAYLDVAFPNGATTVQGVFSSTGLWSVFQSGADNGSGSIQNLGGSVLPGGIGMEPEWIRVGYVQILANTSAPAAAYTLSQSSAGLAALARGLISWNDVSLDGRTLTQGIAGDIDSDGDKDDADISLFVSVLLGTEQQEVFRIASDFTGDGIPSGLDVQPFVDAFMGAP